ncbi:heat shock protein Hsp-16.1/Hsp-16.11-like [Mercenaria mercenaria]|uniref:heat shock protein Hsp-16.1/Hsp-16.11-like n=1 Tax=Mercenaria mercenaria TaxID=6596 RepID=UPI00234F169F|nr:heat shock protein Hsp-16.1/Hsp-16.11-like [Mercenaria mercenaria]
MSQDWNLVPTFRREFDFFDRQRDLFSEWLHRFDDDWRLMEFEDSAQRFDKELERIRDNLHVLDSDDAELSIDNPFITDPEGNRKLSLRFNCSKYNPNEIMVKTLDNRLCVHAKHEDETEHGKIHREFTREYVLPDNVDPNQLKSHLSKDGVLQIEAPAPPSVEAPKEHVIPIEQL